MKIVSRRRTKTLYKYFKRKGLLKKNPKVLVCLVTSENKKRLREVDKKIQKLIKKEVKEGKRKRIIQTKPEHLTKHGHKEFFPSIGFTCRLYHGKGEITTLVQTAWDHPIPNYKNYRYLIMIESEDLIGYFDRNFEPSKGSAKLPKTYKKFYAFCHVLIHEFMHVVERESLRRIFPEDFHEEQKSINHIWNDLPETFKIETKEDKELLS